MSRLLSHMHCMYIASIRLDFTQNKWNAQNVIWSHTFEPSLHNLITYVKLTQSTLTQ